MNPASAMGTFLRVWRAEWAGLSRAQLALAVSAQVANGKAVTPRAVRWWEEGNAPGSTEELEALCQVMRVRGLTPGEVDDFRKAVFMGCVDRQYPGLFADEDFAERDDVDQAAQALRICAPADTVRVVAALQEIELAATNRPPGEAHHPQRRRQDVALAELLRACAECHAHIMGRERAYVEALEALHRFLAARFAGRLADDLNCHGTEFEIMVARTLLSKSGRELPAMVAYHRGCGESGNTHWGAMCLPVIARLAYEVGDLELGGKLLARSSETLAILGDGDPVHSDMAHGHYAQGSLVAGLLADAERHLSRITHWADVEAGMRDYNWHQWTGGLFLAQDMPGEALGHFEQVLAIARARSNDARVAHDQARLEACEQAVRATRLRRGHSRNAKRKPKSGGKK